MKKTIIFALFVTFSVTTVTLAQESGPAAENAATTFILVRHAEKMSDADNPGLTPDGVNRALMLRNMVSMADIGAIYSTDYKRTKATVQAVSEMANVPVAIYDPVPEKKVTEEWVARHRGKTVLVSGHSNTIPDLANQLLLRPHFDSDFDETDYGNLLVIIVSSNNRTLLHLRY